MLFGGNRVLFGDGARLPAMLGDTWLLRNDEWIRVSQSGPAPRAEAAVGYDRGRGRTVLFGGRTESAGGRAERLGDTWEWDAERWTRVSTPGPSARSGAGELQEGGWVPVQESGPSPRNHAVLVSAPDRGSLLLHGGHDGEMVFGDLWEHRDRRWVRLESAPPVQRIPNGH